MATYIALGGYRIDFWDVFVAGRIEAERATSSVLSDGLPNGFKELSSLKNAGHANTKRVQVFMASNGIVPFSRFNASWRIWSRNNSGSFGSIW